MLQLTLLNRYIKGNDASGFTPRGTMTVFNKDTIKFVAVPAAKVPLPVSSREKKLFLDYDGVFKTIDANGAIVVFGSTQQVPNEQLSLAALESLNKSLVQVQKQVAAIEPVKVKPEDITNLKSDINKQIEFIEVSLKNILPSLAEQADVEQLKSRLQEFQSIVTLSDKQFIDLKQRLSNSIKESNSNIADVLDILQGKISKQQLEATVNGVKKELFKLIPEETVVEAGEVTYGTSDEISVREKDNAYIIDLQLKKHRNEGGGWQASGGVSQSWVEEYVKEALKDYTPTNINIVGTGGITVSVSGDTYYIDGSQISGGVSGDYVPLAGGVAISGNITIGPNYDPSKTLLAGDFSIDTASGTQTTPENIVFSKATSGYGIIKNPDAIRLVPTDATILETAFGDTSLVDTLWISSTDFRLKVDNRTVAFTDELTGGSSISNLTSVDGSVVITPISGGFDLSVTPAAISGNTWLSGQVVLTSAADNYVITHTDVDFTQSIPVVSIESDSNFYRARIYARDQTSFQVKLDALPADGEKILWHMAAVLVAASDIFLGNEFDDIISDEFGNFIKI